MFSIEKGVKRPARKGHAAACKYPFVDMEVDDSFFVEGDSGIINRVRSAATQYQRRHRVKFSVRTVDGGCRVWRVE